MLRDKIEQIKRESPEILINADGGCKFCGQMAQVEVPGTWKPDDIDELACEMCDCREATSYTEKKEQKENAIKRIEQLFITEDPIQEENINILNCTVDVMVEKKLHSLTLDIGNGVKAKLSRTSKGLIKVERTNTEKKAYEE